MYKFVIGLEVHIELSTKSKMFCRCSADHFGKQANTQVCPVCLGLPGALPFTNEEAINSTVKFGLALGAKINKFSKFDRKHYFYPDLPKGYQISQYDLPLCIEGNLTLEKEKVRIRRVHIEEDTGKLQHTEGKSLIDFNRSGVPLMELVTEPDFSDVDEVINFLQEIQRIVRYLGISTADMEKGSMRLEANVSLTDTGEFPKYKVELKNINSFRFLRKALQYEFERQSEILSKSQKVGQETRGYDEKSGKTLLQRSKEEANDYRYFPEPDIPPMKLKDEDINKLKGSIPELPSEKREKYMKLDLPSNYIDVLIDSKERAEYFEEAVELGKKENISAKIIAGLMVNQNLDKDIDDPAALIKKIYQLTQKSFASTDDTKKAVEKVVKDNPKAVKDYREGKGEVIGFLIGQVQKELKGQGDTKIINQFLLKSLMEG